MRRAFEQPDGLRAGPQGAHSREQYLELICAGGYPAALDYSAAQRRRWHRDCLHTVVQRDIVELDDVRRSDAIAPIVETVAALTGQDLNVASARVSSAGRNVAVATTLAGLEYRR